jgi:hypothetical protein
MNSQSIPVTSPFTLIGEYTPNAPKTLPTIKAAPEAAKVSAAEAKPTKKPRTRRAKIEQPATPAPEAQPTLTSAETDMIINLRKFSEQRQASAMGLINALAHQAEHPTEETPAVTLDPEPEPEPAKAEWKQRMEFEESYSYKDGYYMPDGATTETIYDRPYRNVVRHGDIRAAWGIWGRLISTHQVPLPDMRDQSWSDNLECTLNIIAETLAEFDY